MRAKNCANRTSTYSSEVELSILEILQLEVVQAKANEWTVRN